MFVQIIEYQSSRLDDIRALGDSEQARMQGGTARRVTVTADRDRPGWFMSIIEFDDYDSAMENSNRPEVQEFAGRMAALCDGPPRFYNQDSVFEWQQG
jgi:hypothetical protein